MRPPSGFGEQSIEEGSHLLATKIDECEYMTRKEASDYLRRRWNQRISAQTLAIYASRKEGPPYRLTVTGADALYTKADLDAWAQSRLVPGRVAPAS